MGNPFESLSDALTEWKQRLDVIESDETAQKEQEVGDEDADKENDDNIDSEQYAMIPDDVKVDNEEQALMDNDNNEQDQIHNIYNKEDDEDNDMNDNNQFVMMTTMMTLKWKKSKKKMTTMMKCSNKCLIFMAMISSK